MTVPVGLISTKDVAERAKVALSTVTTWRRDNDDFPEAVDFPGRDGRASYFREHEIDAFLERNRLGYRYSTTGVRRGRRPDPLKAAQRASGANVRKERQTGGSAERRDSGPTMGPSSISIPDRLDLIATIALADRGQPSERDAIAQISALAGTVPSTESTDAWGISLVVAIGVLGDLIVERRKTRSAAVWTTHDNAIADRLGFGSRSGPDAWIIQWLASLNNERVSLQNKSSLTIYNRVAARFRRAANPWANRPLDTPNPIQELVTHLGEHETRSLIDLTCGIGTVANHALMAGISVVGLDRDSFDIRTARQWALVIEADAVERGHKPISATRDFDGRGALTATIAEGTYERADIVLLSEPSADSMILKEKAASEQWGLVTARIDAARSLTAPGGRTVFVLPTYQLDPQAERPRVNPSTPAAISARQQWAAHLEAVIEVPISRTPISHTVLIFHGARSRSREERVLFATLTADCSDITGVENLLQILRSERRSPNAFLEVPGVTRTSALVDRDRLVAGDANLTPHHWWRVEFAQQTDRLDALLQRDQSDLNSAIQRTNAAMEAASGMTAKAKPRRDGDTAWISFTDLERAGLIDSVVPLARPLPYRAMQEREPIIYPARPEPASPLAPDVWTDELGYEFRGRNQLELGDVVFWHEREAMLNVVIVDTRDQALLIRPGRACRITIQGQRKGLTPELLAFVIETSSSTIARSVSARTTETLRFPAATPNQDPLEAVRWAKDTFGDLAKYLAELRGLELAARDLAHHTAALRRDATVFGSAGAVRARLPRPLEE